MGNNTIKKAGQQLYECYKKKVKQITNWFVLLLLEVPASAGLHWSNVTVRSN